ncbi:hypothetical protein BDC45DRAFT_523253 [Circinella umbellata]|nr:hypothetical protein BDC45DRAFT_523253 [Circinella umbellata]
MNSPLNPILGHHRERTSAIRSYPHYQIEIESDATKRHKWDGVMITNKKPNATIMTIEFAGGFGLQKIYRNMLRVFNADSPNASAPYPRIYCSYQSQQGVFESLVQIDNEVYVRRRSAELTLPAYFSSFQDAVEALLSIFTWRDTVVNYTVSLPKDNQTKMPLVLSTVIIISLRNQYIFIPPFPLYIYICHDIRCISSNM